MAWMKWRATEHVAFYVSITKAERHFSRIPIRHDVLNGAEYWATKRQHA
jgi:hypothetical protein